MIYEGIVIEVGKKDAVLMTPEKVFVTVKKRYNYKEGDHIYFKNKDIIRDKKFLYFVAPICASAAIFICALLMFINPANNVYAYIHMDVDSSVEISVNKQNKVVDVSSINDGEGLLKGLNLNGKNLALAMEELLEKSIELRLVTHEKNDVLYSTSLKDEKSQYELDDIFKSLKEATSEIKGVEIESYSVKVDTGIREKSKSFYMSMGRYMVFKKLNNMGKDMSVGNVREMSVAEVIKELKEDNRQHQDPQTSGIKSTSSISSSSSSISQTSLPNINEQPSVSPLQSSQASNLLVTMDPGMVKLSPEPVEIINNQSISPTPKKTPDKSLAKPNIPNLIVNGDFSNQIDGWFYKSVNGAQADVFVQNGELNIAVLKQGSDLRDFSLDSSLFSLTKGKKYIVRFEAYSSENLDLKVRVTEKDPTWTWHAGGTFKINTKKGEYFLRFDMKHQSSHNNSVIFTLESPGASLFLDNVRIYEDNENNSIEENWGVNILKNGSFADRLEGWSAFYSMPAKGKLILVNEGAKMVIQNGGSQQGHVKLSSSPLSLVKGKTYTVEFEASSTVEIPAKFMVSLPYEPWEWYGGNNLTLSMERKKYNFSFKMVKESTNNPLLIFHLGGYKGDVYFYNIAVYEHD